MSGPPWSGLEHDLHALVLLVLEGLEAVGCVLQSEAVGDHEARVDVAVADVLVEALRVALHVALAGLERQALVHERPGRELVHEAAVDAHDGHDAGGPAREDRVAEGVPAVALGAGGLLDALDGVQRAVPVRRLHADGVDHRVRPAAARELLELLDDVGVLGEVDRVGRSRPLERHLQPVVVLVDGDHALGPEHDGARDRELPHGPRPEHRDHLAAGDLAKLGSHEARREDVRQEEHLLVGQVVLDLDRPDVGVGDAGVLGLAAGVAARDVRVAEDAGRRVAEELLGDARVRVGVLADGVELVLAGPAVAAGDRERDDDAVADLEVGDAPALLDDLAHELVAEDVALAHRRDVAVVEVQVGPADRRGADLHDGVAVVEDLRVRDVLHLHGVPPRPHVRAHHTPAFSSSDSDSGCAGCCLSLRSSDSPSGVPSERGTSPVSTCCLNWRRPSLILASGSLPVSFWTVSPSLPPGALLARSTWISVPRSPGAGLKVTAASASSMYWGRCPELLQSCRTSSGGRWTVMAALRPMEAPFEDS